MDVLLVASSLIFTLPLMVALAILIATDGHNPFFLQERIGKDGRRFRMLKFRSMIPDADKALKSHLEADPEAAQEWNKYQKLKDDPRVTFMGRFLRKTSLDELPQIFNVLKGDMSLIGPRPMLPCQVSLYPGTAYFSLRPGISGPWQVSSRNDAEFASRAKYDTRYEQDVSIGTDLTLLYRTFCTVARGTGY